MKTREQLEQELAEARKENAKLRDEMCRWISRSGVGLMEAKMKAEQERDTALKALAESEKERGRLRKALDLIKSAHGCGCHPKCQCDQEGALRIWKQEAMSIATEALTPESGEKGK